MRNNTQLDTEAKLFEYFSDLYQTKPFTSITLKKASQSFAAAAAKEA